MEFASEGTGTHCEIIRPLVTRSRGTAALLQKVLMMILSQLYSTLEIFGLDIPVILPLSCLLVFFFQTPHFLLIFLVLPHFSFDT